MLPTWPQEYTTAYGRVPPMTRLKVGKQTLCRVCGSTWVLMCSWLALRPPVVKRPSDAFMFPDRMFLITLTVLRLVKHGLLD